MICSRCVLDDSVPDIVFDANGVCQFCHLYDRHKVEIAATCTRDSLVRLISEMKEGGKGKKYDCVIGLSGGRDSSYLAYLAVTHFGLRVLATQVDNGANDPIAVRNTQNLVDKLKLDFEPYSLDLKAFKRIQLAYYRAGVMGLEIPVDHAIVMSYRLKAGKYGIRYSLSGHNWATESHLPESWTFDAYDLVNIRDICLKNGASRGDLMELPTMSRSKLAFYDTQGIKEVRLLNYLLYKQADAEKVLVEEMGWESYGLKHWESITTRFYQTYILPTRWGIDKRKSHFSALIASGQMTRNEALGELSLPPCDLVKVGQDKAFIIKWLGIEPQKFDEYMALPRVPHTAYKTEKQYKAWKDRMRPLYRLVKTIVAEPRDYLAFLADWCRR